jgi:hypothetical protein
LWPCDFSSAVTKEFLGLSIKSGSCGVLHMY